MVKFLLNSAGLFRLQQLDSPRAPSQRLIGATFAFLGMLVFSQTLTATKIALVGFSSGFVTFGRSASAGILAVIYLCLKRSQLPGGREAFLLLMVGLCVVIGFPALSSLALKNGSASQSGLVTALTPFFTAVMAATIASRIRILPKSFWFFSSLGSFTVIFFAMFNKVWVGASAMSLLLAASIVVSIGYVMGNYCAKTRSSSEVISWAIVLCMPFTVPLAYGFRPVSFSMIPLGSWMSMGYLVFFSQFLGFIAWYAGLARGNAEEVCQIQLFQTGFTNLGAWFLLSEEIPPSAWICTLLVMICVYFARNSLKKYQGTLTPPKVCLNYPTVSLPPASKTGFSLKRRVGY